MLLVDGIVAGVWHQRRAGRTIEVTVEPLRRLSARRQAALAEQVERVGAFFDRPVRHAIGTVTVGAHA